MESIVCWEARSYVEHGAVHTSWGPWVGGRRLHVIYLVLPSPGVVVTRRNACHAAHIFPHVAGQRQQPPCSRTVGAGSQRAKGNTRGAVKFCRLVCHCWRRCERYPASHTAAATEVEQKAAAAAAAAQIFLYSLFAVILKNNCR